MFYVFVCLLLVGDLLQVSADKQTDCCTACKCCVSGDPILRKCNGEKSKLQESNTLLAAIDACGLDVTVNMVVPDPSHPKKFQIQNMNGTFGGHTFVFAGSSLLVDGIAPSSSPDYTVTTTSENILLVIHSCGVRLEYGLTYNRGCVYRLENAPCSSAGVCYPNTCLPTNCADIQTAGNNVSGVYQISVNEQVHDVYCDLETDGGRWLLFQRRQDGSVSFQRTWDEYKAGFGDVNGEFWLGNELVSTLVNGGQTYELRIDLWDWDMVYRYTGYSTFTLGDEADSYAMSIGVYSGDASNSMATQNGVDFATADRDNFASCASSRKGGWWFENCGHANLNGLYQVDGINAPHAQTVVWYQWKGWDYGLKITEMKIRPVAV